MITREHIVVDVRYIEDADEHALIDAMMRFYMRRGRYPKSIRVSGPTYDALLKTWGHGMSLNGVKVTR